MHIRHIFFQEVLYSLYNVEYQENITWLFNLPDGQSHCLVYTILDFSMCWPRNKPKHGWSTNIEAVVLIRMPIWRFCMQLSLQSWVWSLQSNDTIVNDVSGIHFHCTNTDMLLHQLHRLYLLNDWSLKPVGQYRSNIFMIFSPIFKSCVHIDLIWLYSLCWGSLLPGVEQVHRWVLSTVFINSPSLFLRFLRSFSHAQHHFIFVKDSRQHIVLGPGSFFGCPSVSGIKCADSKARFSSHWGWLWCQLDHGDLYHIAWSLFYHLTSCLTTSRFKLQHYNESHVLAMKTLSTYFDWYCFGWSNVIIP